MRVVSAYGPWGWSQLSPVSTVFASTSNTESNPNFERIVKFARCCLLGFFCLRLARLGKCLNLGGNATAAAAAALLVASA